MKKTVIQIIVCVLCLMLCACGGLSGEKAAELYPDIIGNWGTDPIVISRSQAGHASDLASEAIGTWAVAEDLTNPVAAFHEDGTCTIRGADGLWSVDYTNMHNLPSDGYWELLAKINDNGYQIYLNDIGNGRFAMSIYSKDMEILPFSDMVKIP